ncbi:phosphate ABC transporter permease PstA [Chelatococcus sp. SYSU_G07232]|uniref:Phosphate transport system permease protein PstA n=1 Tax=Chelatococcus albus TaxID=3047466 RepID=A0ABT7AFA7_9HYPH|nr:phosphate ABC transporter permease PstA [Chelatococcus sp. SYSU_G07232]MDJ1158018.1 phosphate ABC transporter permease PstA [Chelatococcus sp. SYSU_G07232]
MTDLAAPLTRASGAGLSPDAARARIRRRYRAEARFRLYGMLAVGFAALMLVVLIADVVNKAWPAFFETRVRLGVTPTLEQVSTDGKLERTSLMGGDYDAVLRTSLQELFPGVKDRASRRKLFNDLLSTGASAAVRERVLADPSLVGKTFTVPALLDDAADLYFKGLMTGRSERGGRGTLIPSATTGEITLTSTADDFSADLADTKRALAATARSLRREAERLLRSAAALPAGDERARLEQQAAEIVAQAADKEQRLAATGGAEPLDASEPSKLVVLDGGIIKLTSLGTNEATGIVLAPLASTQPAAAGSWKVVTLDQPEANRKLGDQQIAWLEQLRDKGLVERAFATRFFTSGDSREPEQAGILGGLVGSALTMLVTLVLCLPVGVGAAIYLEEFAPKNRLTDLVEVNINNLAAVPSIVFGLLGLAVFLNFFGLPRSAPLVGGLVLALLVLPTIIIASRAALKAVPPSIREGALGIGASHQQAVFHHVLPLAMPGIMTGTIIGMAHALGETAPLLLIGMVAFIVDVPAAVTDAATVLPVQIFLWSDLPEAAFQAKTAGAIIVLLVFLFIMNGVAILLRRRFERRW